MINFVYIIFLIAASCFHSAIANLDGTLNPIFVQTTYSFTNGERADGLVCFKEGFDLPPSGTIRLNLAPGSAIDGLIQGNRSTIILENDCYLGPSFDLQGDLFFSSTSGKALLFRGRREYDDLKLRLLGQIDLIGLGYAELIFTGSSTLDMRSTSLTACRFINLVLTFNRATCLATGTNLTPLFVINSQLKFGNDATSFINNSSVIFDGDCGIAVAPPGLLKFGGRITVQETGNLRINALSKIEAKRLITTESNTKFILENSVLDISDPAAVNNIVTLGNSIVSGLQGQFRVEGKSTLASSAGNRLQFSNFFEIVITEGSLLTIDKGCRVQLF